MRSSIASAIDTPGRDPADYDDDALDRLADRIADRLAARLSGLARKFAHVSREGGQAASEVGWVSVLARSLWRSSRVNFHWKGAAICS